MKPGILTNSSFDSMSRRPSIAQLFALAMGGQVYVSIRFYPYGDGAPAAVARDEPLWQTWMKELFPPVGGASDVA